MKEPARLIDTSKDPELRRLLRAGRSETPSEQALHRTLRAAAVGGGVAASGLAAAAPSAAGTTALGTASAPLTTAGVGTGLSASTAGAVGSLGGVGAKLVVATGVAKWAGLGALTAASVVLSPEVVDWVQQSPQPVAVYSVAIERSERNTPGPKAAREDSKLEDLVAAAGSSSAAAPEVHPIVGVEAKPAAPIEVLPRGTSSRRLEHPPGALPDVPRKSSAAQELVPAPDSVTALDGFTAGQVSSEFAEQVKVVEQARRAIAQADAASGLALLADYETRFTRTQLLPEVLLLRLDAFERLGRKRDAHVVARRILQRGATGVHAARARASLGQ